MGVVNNAWGGILNQSLSQFSYLTLGFVLILRMFLLKSKNQILNQNCCKSSDVSKLNLSSFLLDFLKSVIQQFVGLTTSKSDLTVRIDCSWAKFNNYQQTNAKNCFINKYVELQRLAEIQAPTKQARQIGPGEIGPYEIGPL